MKKTTYLLIILCLIITLLFASCKTDYKYIASTDSITKIEIIHISGNNVEIINNINDNNEFINELSDIHCYINTGDPVELSDGKAIRIFYDSGNYEIISADAQKKYINGKYQNGYRFFDTDSFNDLINNYS